MKVSPAVVALSQRIQAGVAVEDLKQAFQQGVDVTTIAQQTKLPVAVVAELRTLGIETAFTQAHQHAVEIQARGLGGAGGDGSSGGLQAQNAFAGKTVAANNPLTIRLQYAKKDFAVNGELPAGGIRQRVEVGLSLTPDADNEVMKHLRSLAGVDGMVSAKSLEAADARNISKPDNTAQETIGRQVLETARGLDAEKGLTTPGPKTEAVRKLLLTWGAGAERGLPGEPTADASIWQQGLRSAFNAISRNPSPDYNTVKSAVKALIVAERVQEMSADQREAWVGKRPDPENKDFAFRNSLDAEVNSRLNLLLLSDGLSPQGTGVGSTTLPAPGNVVVNIDNRVTIIDQSQQATTNNNQQTTNNITHIFQQQQTVNAEPTKKTQKVKKKPLEEEYAVDVQVRKLNPGEKGVKKKDLEHALEAEQKAALNKINKPD